jgi:hypothetical protein
VEPLQSAHRFEGGDGESWENARCDSGQDGEKDKGCNDLGLIPEDEEFSKFWFQAPDQRNEYAAVDRIGQNKRNQRQEHRFSQELYKNLKATGAHDSANTYLASSGKGTSHGEIDIIEDRGEDQDQ